MHIPRAFSLAAVGLLTTCTVASATAPDQVPAPTTSVAAALPTSPTSFPTEAPTPAPTPVNTYVVGPTDTVSSIANYFGLTVQQIVGLNPGLEVNPDQLISGDVLAVGPGGTSQLQTARTPPVPAPAVAAYV